MTSLHCWHLRVQHQDSENHSGDCNGMNHTGRLTKCWIRFEKLGVGKISSRERKRDAGKEMLHLLS